MALHPETRAVHTPVPSSGGASRPLSTPIHQTSAFAFDDPDLLADAMSRPDGDPVYTRMGNPTVRALEQALADLENGTAALAASAGMGAITTVLHGLLRTGDHVIAQRRLYGGTHGLLHDLAERYGIGLTLVSGDDPAEITAAARPESRLLYLETLANPTARAADLPALLAAGRAAGLTGVVDNTFATPLLCRPLDHGADIVVHSTTKYLAGHSDVIGGASVFADDALWRHLWKHSNELGVTADPFAAWLTLRGLHTLPLRMRRHGETALLLAERLAAHPSVTAVHYPGLPSDPGHATAARLLDAADYGYGGIMAVDLAGGRDAGRAFSRRIRVATLGPSLGGVETLVMHSASTSHRQLTEEELGLAGIGPGTVRISVGLEHAGDLWADFEQALKG